MTDLKKNLRQHIENSFPEYAFMTILYVYPRSLTVEEALTKLIVQKNELKEFQQLSKCEIIILNAAFKIRKISKQGTILCLCNLLCCPVVLRNN